MLIPVYVLWNHASSLPWYIGPVMQILGLGLLLVTMKSVRFNKKSIRYNKVASSAARVLAICLVSWGWVEIFSVGRDFPMPASIIPILHTAFLVFSAAVFLMGFLDPAWSIFITAAFIYKIIFFLIYLDPILSYYVKDSTFISAFLYLAERFYLVSTVVFESSDVIPVFSFGFLLGVWSVWSMGARRSFLYSAPDDPLVSKGPYRFMRHPQAAASLLMLWPAVCGLSFEITPPNVSAFYEANFFIFLIIVCFSIMSEEKDLAGRMGEEYEDYRGKTPRFFSIGLKEFRNRRKIRFDFVQSFLIISAVIFLSYFVFVWPLIFLEEKGILVYCENVYGWFHCLP